MSLVESGIFGPERGPTKSYARLTQPRILQTHPGAQNKYIINSRRESLSTIREVARLLEAAIGIEPMNKGFAVLKTLFQRVKGRSVSSGSIEAPSAQVSVLIEFCLVRFGSVCTLRARRSTLKWYWVSDFFIVHTTLEGG
jgi:hypothetical protein